MSKQFVNLEVGAVFSGGTSNGAGVDSKAIMEMIYKKISKSKAECIEQYGYGNKRAVGAVYCFSPYQRVYNAS